MFQVRTGFKVRVLDFSCPFPQQMGPFTASYILLVVSAVRAFQYTELAQYVDSHQEEYVEVNLINGIQKNDTFFQNTPMTC